MTESSYMGIQPSGHDTGSPLNLTRRLAMIERHVRVAGARILDCGCGTGQYLLALLQRGGDVMGVEFFGAKVQAFRRQHGPHAARMRQGDIERLDFEAERFDAVLLNEVLEHVPDQRGALAEAYRVLAADGHLIVFSPNRLYPFETHGVTLKRPEIDIPLWVPLIPYVPLALGKRIFRYHARNYRPRELRALIERQGFEVVHTDYAWQTFENISGQQPRLVAALRPWLRAAFGLLEKVPLIRALGISQVVVAKKPAVRALEDRRPVATAA